MKKKIIISICSVFAIALIAAAMVFVYRSGQNSVDPTDYADAKFINTMEKNLKSRAKVSESTSDDSQDVSYYEKLVDSENSIYSFENATYRDEHLKKLVSDYIKGLDLQKEAISYSSDATKFDETWEEGYRLRSIVISELAESYKLDLPDEIQHEFNSVAKLAKEAEAEKKAIKEMFDSVVFEKSKTVGDYSYYTAVVENTSGYDFEYLNLNINLLKDDTILETAHAYINTWSNGTKAQFEFNTNKEFDNYEVHGEYNIIR